MAEKSKHANKVVVNGETILDLTQDTVEPSSLLKGTTAHDKSGAQVTGTYEAPVASVNSKTGAVVLSASDVGAQPKITANGFLKGDGSSNITADRPAFRVEIEEAQDGTVTANKTPEEIYAAYSAGYAVYAIYGTLDGGFTLPLKVAYPHITGFFGASAPTDNVVFFVLVSNTGDGWVKQKMSVPLTDKVVPTTRTINSKPLSANITLNASDVNAVGLEGNQTIAGNKTFSGEVTFGSGFTAPGSAFTGGCIFKGQQSFDDGMVVDWQTYYKENSYISGKIRYGEDSTVDFTNATVTGLSGQLPAVDTPNNGQFLRVVNGAWAAATVENANGVSF